MLLAVRKRSIIATPTTAVPPQFARFRRGMRVCVCSLAANSAIPLLLLYVAADYRAQSLQTRIAIRLATVSPASRCHCRYCYCLVTIDLIFSLPANCPPASLPTRFIGTWMTLNRLNSTRQ